MIEETLLQYGAVGALCVGLLSIIIWQQKRDEKLKDKLSQVIENNTIAMTRFYEVAKRCENGR